MSARSRHVLVKNQPYDETVELHDDGEEVASVYSPPPRATQLQQSATQRSRARGLMTADTSSDEERPQRSKDPPGTKYGCENSVSYE